jgi:hypothetical protein
MLDVCANPQCAKPLRYLREGRIFVFDASSAAPPDGKRAHRLEHYWLCGECSRTLYLERTQQGVRVSVKVDHSRALAQAG